MLTPSRHKEMATQVVKENQVSIRRACHLFSLAEICYRHQPRLSDEKSIFADWLLRLTYTDRRWGFRLCFL